MKRRDFLKLIGVAPIAPTVLAAMPKKELTVAATREFVDKMPKYQSESFTIPVGKDNYEWIVTIVVACDGAAKTVTIDGILPEDFYVK